MYYADLSIIQIFAKFSLAIFSFRPLLMRLNPVNGACLLSQIHASFHRVLCIDLNIAHLVACVVSFASVGRGLALLVLPTVGFLQRLRLLSMQSLVSVKPKYMLQPQI